MGCMTSVQEKKVKDIIKEGDKLINMSRSPVTVHNGMADMQAKNMETIIQANIDENQNMVDEMIGEMDVHINMYLDAMNIESNVNDFSEGEDEQVHVLMLQTQLDMLSDDDTDDTDEQIRVIVEKALLNTI